VLADLRVVYVLSNSAPLVFNSPMIPSEPALSCAVTAFSSGAIPVVLSRWVSVASAAEWSVIMCSANCFTRALFACWSATRA